MPLQCGVAKHLSPTCDRFCTQLSILKPASWRFSQVDADEHSARNGWDSGGQHDEPVGDTISPVMHDPGQESVATALGSEEPVVMNGE